MLKICGVSICKHLETILRFCLNHCKFPVFKKDDKQCVKNYRSVSLLPICGKIFERIIYNNAYNYLIHNNLV